MIMDYWRCLLGMPSRDGHGMGFRLSFVLRFFV